MSQRVLQQLPCRVSEPAKQSFYLTAKTFSDDCFKSRWQVFFITTNPSFSLFHLVCQKPKILHGMKLNQEILTKLLKRVHGPSINLLCSSDYQTTYSFCEIKHFVKQANSLLFHFQRLLLKNITCFITSFLVLRVF